jgi:Na+-transporting NADH:ubiquinone oxidoreductase subunit A
MSKNVEKHTAEGPHPIGTHSVHIHFISPIQHADEVVWTLNVHDVICIGYLLTKGKYFTDRIISIAGPGILVERVGFFKARAGYPIENLVIGRIEKGDPKRLISGDVLTGDKVEIDEFLGFHHFVFSVFPENRDREFLHFFKLGLDKYTASKTYLSGHLNHSERLYDFTTNQHGEKRGFVVNSPYEQVMPMQIPTMQLVKAILAEDYELAEEMGLLEVEPEDFALATFVCPSKIEMSEIVKIGLKEHAAQVLS